MGVVSCTGNQVGMTSKVCNQSGSGLMYEQSKWEWPPKCAITVGVVSCMGNQSGSGLLITVEVVSCMGNQSGSGL